MNEHSATITSTTNHDETSYFNVLKSWSLGGIGTSILVESRMGTRIVLDVGSTPIFQDTVSANIVIISHGHLDHSGGIFSHARAHYLLFQKIPTYYMPLALVDKVRNVERALWDLDSAQTDDDDRKNKISTSATPPPGMPITIVGVKPGDEILLSNTAQNERLLIRVFQVQHEGHPSVGYVLCRKLPQRLLPEFIGLPHTEIRDLVQRGVQIKSDGEIVMELSYTGDTCDEGLCLPSPETTSTTDSMQCCYSEDRNRNLLHLRQAFQAPIILCELTYLENIRSDPGGSRGHMRIGDVAKVFSSHGWDNNNSSSNAVGRKGQKIIFFHFSARHGPAKRALELLLLGLPDWIIPYCYGTIFSLLSKEEKRGCHNFPIELVEDNGCIQLTSYRATLLQEREAATKNKRNELLDSFSSDGQA